MDGLRSVTPRGDVAITQVIFTENSYSVPKTAKQAITAKGAPLIAAGLTLSLIHI